MKNTLGLTVITSNFNGEKFIEETIKSVLGQTDTDFEYILYDALSNDNSRNIIEKYRDQINIIRYQKDNGLYDALSQAINIASGDIIIWINSDDLLDKDAVRNVKRVFNADRSIQWINGKNGYIKKNIKFSFIPYIYPNFIIKNGYAHHSYWGYIQQESVAFKKSLYLQTKGFRFQNTNRAGDYFLWRDFSNLTKLETYNIPSGYVRSWRGQSTNIFRTEYNLSTGKIFLPFSFRYLRLIISILFYPIIILKTYLLLNKNR